MELMLSYLWFLQRYDDTPLAKVFASADHFQVLLNRATLLRTRASLLQKQILLRDAFDIFDTVGVLQEKIKSHTFSLRLRLVVHGLLI